MNRKRKALLTLTILFLLAAVCSLMSLPGLPAASAQEWVLVWNDEFDGTEVDPGKWNVLDHPNGINNDLAYMTPDNVYLENGELVLKQTRCDVTYDGETYDYCSGKVNTQYKFIFQYGRVEIRAKVPAGRGFHTAFWTMTEGCSGTATGNVNCVWPPEIDIVEVLGEDTSMYYTYYHAGETDEEGGGTWHPLGYDLSDDYHVYAIEWEPTEIRWYLDGQLYQTLTQAQADIAEAGLYNHILILDTTIGGDWPARPNPQTPFPSFNRIDYVRVYQIDGTPYPTLTPLPPTNTPLPTPSTSNLALNQPVTASSEESGTTLAGYAVDGSMTTRWASEWSDPQWIYVDLGATYDVKRVRLYWEDSYSTAYQVQMSSDASNWTDIYSTTTGDGGLDDLIGLSGSGRYLRIYGTARYIPYGHSLWEIEVYDSDIGPTHTPSPTDTPTPTVTPGGPTDTPVPTNTPIPTNTPVPTNTPIPTNTPVPTSTPITGAYVYVSDITMSYATTGPNYYAKATITVLDDQDNPVQGATVYGTFTGATYTEREGITDEFGHVMLQSGFKKNGGAWSFCVDDIVKSGYAYNEAANVETCDGITAP